MSIWRLLDTGARDGAWNMACDEALMQRARSTGESVVRIYGWSRPTLSFGRHEAAKDRYDAAAISAAGIDTVRRPTGGRALLHDHEVTYSVTAPVEHAVSLGASVQRINQWLLRALHHLGVPAIEAETPRALRPEGAACFAVPAAGELTLGGLKLVGSAQVRTDGALLQHGSILLQDDQAQISQFARGPFLPPAPAAALRDALGADATYEAVRDALFEVVTHDVTAQGGRVVLLDERDAALSPAQFIAPLAHFRSAEWTWRR